MLKISNLSASYDHIDALHNVNIEVAEGSIVSIIGSNGAGKTTLLNTISGLVPAKEGAITYKGVPLEKIAHIIVQKGIVQVPEGRKIFAGLSVRENLILGGFHLGKHERRVKIEEMFKRFPRLKERESQQAGTMSGGEQQMLAICRGLMSNPKLILLDEPSLGLAPVLVSDVFKQIAEIRRMGITVLLVEQNARKALSMCDYAYVLENGRVILQGRGEELLCNEAISKAYLGESQGCKEDAGADDEGKL
ncbi:MAG: ABC transporter ATP-binding protein [Spirochaetales bacterium]|nr:ABC transporter ATP-binding protein [Spirochaetales bacterium]